MIPMWASTVNLLTRKMTVEVCERKSRDTRSTHDYYGVECVCPLDEEPGGEDLGGILIMYRLNMAAGYPEDSPEYWDIGGGEAGEPV